MRELCRRAGLPDDQIDASALADVVHGYVISALESPRASIAPLARHFGFDAIESEGRVRFQPRDQRPVATLQLDVLAVGEHTDGEVIELVRAQETELPHALKWQVLNAEEDYDAMTVEARRATGEALRVTSESFAIATIASDAEACHRERGAAAARRARAARRPRPPPDSTAGLAGRRRSLHRRERRDRRLGRLGPEHRLLGRRSLDAAGAALVLAGLGRRRGDLPWLGRAAWTAAGLPAFFTDAVFQPAHEADPTRRAIFDLAAIAAGTTRTFALPDVSTEFAGLSGAQTFDGDKTFSGALTASGPAASIGTAPGTATYGLGTGATAAGATKTVNLGTGGVAGSDTVVNIGSATPGTDGTTVINTPTVTACPRPT